MDNYYLPLSEEHHSAEAFLKVWQDAHASINRHLYRGPGYQHPHFVQGDIYTGATRAFWIDSLSAYYPGLLTLAGDIEEATEIHLLATAVWTRFSALPERWNVATGNVDNGLGWWGGRPEFIESTYYLYRATKDPWYLHVGEMVLRDIKRRCWTRCGWAGLQDVRSGELNDRMESFFLGETAKYMFLLYDPAHPLNNLDAPWVFSTEGHPLILPKNGPRGGFHRQKTEQSVAEPLVTGVCQTAPPSPPLGVSSTAARSDIFHAASLARLHLMPSRGEAEGAILEYAADHPSVTLSDLFSPSNYTFYPWTLPPELVPFNATSSPMAIRPTLDISFPNLPGMVLGLGSLERVRDGVLVKAIGGLRLGMVQDVPLEVSSSSYAEGFRIQVVNNLPLGRDERVYLSREITFDVLNPSDPNFTRIRDPVMLDIVIDVEPELFNRGNRTSASSDHAATERREPLIHEHTSLGSSDDKLGSAYSHGSNMKTALSALMNHVSSILRDDVQPSALGLSQSKDKPARVSLPAITSVGPGSAPLPDVEEASIFGYLGKPSLERLTWSSIYLADEICDYRLPLEVVRNYQVLVIKRGGCTFSQKLRNIPAYPSSGSALQFVIVVSYEESEEIAAASKSGKDLNMKQRSFVSTAPPTSPLYPAAAILAEPFLVRPHLDETQVTSGGVSRRNPISMVMVGGGDDTYALLRSSTGVGIKRRYMMRSQGVPITNLYII